MTATEQSPAEFRGLDPDMPSIAALAAAELDTIIRKEPSELTNLRRLADLLSTSFDTSDRAQTAQRLLDPVSANILTKSLRDSNYTTLQSYNDLAAVQKDLINQMRRITTHRSDTDQNMHTALKTMKEFCLLLSHYALSSKGRIDSLNIEPEYRR